MAEITRANTVYCPTNCTSLVHSHDLGITKCWSSFTECCSFDGQSKEHTTENKWLQAVYFTVLALLHVTHTTVKCHRLCMCQLNVEAWLTLQYWRCWYLPRGQESASPRQCQVPFLGTWTITLQVVAFQPLISCVMTVWMAKKWRKMKRRQIWPSSSAKFYRSTHSLWNC